MLSWSCFATQSTCYQPWSQLTTTENPHTGPSTHSTHISAYTAVCVPPANMLLHAQTRKLCHFIFVLVTISHVFSGRSWIIPRRMSACRPTQAATCWSEMVPTLKPKKHVSQCKEHWAFWVFFLVLCWNFSLCFQDHFLERTEWLWALTGKAKRKLWTAVKPPQCDRDYYIRYYNNNASCITAEFLNLITTCSYIDSEQSRNHSFGMIIMFLISCCPVKFNNYLII